MYQRINGAGDPVARENRLAELARRDNGVRYVSSYRERPAESCGHMASDIAYHCTERGCDITGCCVTGTDDLRKLRSDEYGTVCMAMCAKCGRCICQEHTFRVPGDAEHDWLCRDCYPLVADEVAFLAADEADFLAGRWPDSVAEPGVKPVLRLSGTDGNVFMILSELGV